MNIPDRNRVTEVKSLLSGAKVLAIALSAEDLNEKLLNSVGAAKWLDKTDLANQLIRFLKLS